MEFNKYMTEACQREISTDEKSITVKCPSNCGDGCSVWGSDVYTSDSCICPAAIHAGAIDKSEGGTVTLYPGSKCDQYDSLNRNGVDTYSYGTWNRSFTFAATSSTGHSSATITTTTTSSTTTTIITITTTTTAKTTTTTEDDILSEFVHEFVHEFVVNSHYNKSTQPSPATSTATLMPTFKAIQPNLNQMAIKSNSKNLETFAGLSIWQKKSYSQVRWDNISHSSSIRT